MQIKGRYLLAADDGDVVDGSTTVGAHTKNVPLVAHTHGFTTDGAGIHSHLVAGWTDGAGGHSHTRGSMNITGYHDSSDDDPAHYGGAFYFTSRSTTHNNQQTGGSANTVVNFDASRNWTGSTSAAANHQHQFSVTSADNGEHSHTGITASVGGSASFDVRPASIYVYMWRRTA